MMISDFAIKKPIVTIVTMLAISAFGVFALFNLKTDEYPDVQQPLINITILYPGSSPTGVESEIVNPIEEAVSSINGVDKMQSTAYDGYAQTYVYFEFDKDLDVASQEIRDKIAEIRADLPAEMEEPTLSRFSAADMPIVSLTLSSATATPTELTQVADPSVTRVLRSIAGVSDVNVIGGVERELTVELRPDALEAAGISVAQVVRALEMQNLSVPVGRVNRPLDERSIRLRSRLRGPQDFADVVIATRGDRTIRLGELATVRDGEEEPRSLALHNGEQAIGIDIIKARGYSTTDVGERVLEKVAELQGTLAHDARLDVVTDRSKQVEGSVMSVQRALLEGAVLTVLVVFLFLNSWRSTVITGLALPVSVLAAFAAVWAFGFTLNTMSLMGLSLAIGILIDDAIVVRENIVRHVDMGKDHRRAAHEGTSEIGLAVAATTFSIVCVFVPVAFMDGVSGQWFKPFALTIAASVLVSLFVSFSLDPMLSAFWPEPHLKESEKGWLTRQLDKFNRWFDRKAEGYKYIVAWALDHRLAMVAIALVSFVGAIALQATVGGAEFMAESDQSQFQVRVETPPGSSLEYTRLKAEEAARIARTYPEVEYTYTTLGTATGSVDEATISVQLTPRHDRDRSQAEVTDALRAEINRIGGADYAVFSNYLTGAQKQIQIEMRGRDAAELTRLAGALAAQVEQIPGAVDVGINTRGEKPELVVELDRGVAGTLGLTAGDVAQSLRPAFAGVDAGDWEDPTGEMRDVMVRFTPEARQYMGDLERLPLVVYGPAGATTVPLRQIAGIDEGFGPAQISHLDQDRVVYVQANISGRPLNDVLIEINTRIAAFELPAGYQITQGGQAKDQEEVFTSIFVALGIAVMLMYMILVMQFGSFLDPLAILMSLPLSLIGVVLALLVTGDTLNIMSLIGVILLMGIVAKNAILLIDFAKVSRAAGMSRRDALIEAGRTRLRPILMTTFALIAGMIPVAIGHGEGGDFRAPLGRAVIGGTVTSTLLTLLVIPTFYEILDEARERVTAWLKRDRSAESGHSAPALIPAHAEE
jgi:HAE1 family hydrophobic/amphiphilic exporter-1